MNSRNRNTWILLILLPLLCVLCLLAGASGFGWPDLTTPTGRALLELRLSRVLTGFVVGASLACSGAALQAVLRNALAEPYVLGVSSGGALGAALAIATGLSAYSPFAIPGAAFLAAGLTLLVLCLLASHTSGYAPTTIILAGVVTGAMLSSLLMLVLVFAPTRAVHSITWWLLGNLQSTSWPLLASVTIFAALALLTLCYEGRALNALLLGQETAQTLGVEIKRAVPLILAAATLAAAAAVAIAGIIGFVGLIIPHALRRLIGADHQRLIPCCALAGGTFLVVCDALARMFCAPHEIPVGVITALSGGPFFLYLLMRKTPGTSD